MAGLHGKDGDVEAKCSRTGVSHQHAARRGVEIQVREKRCHEQVIGYGEASEDIVENHTEREDNHTGKARAESVDTVGTVCNVDRNPDQDDAEDYVDHFRNRKGHASEVDRGGIVIHKGDDGHNGDDEVNRAFFVIAPRGFGCIVEVAAQHDADEQDRVDHILGAKRQEQYASDQETDDDHEADAAQFSAGEAAVYGKFSAVIARQKGKWML